MPRPATGTVVFRPAKGDEAAGWWGKITDAQGQRTPWMRIGDWPNSSQGKARAKETIASHSEKLRELGFEARPQRGQKVVAARAPKSDGTMAAWFTAWISERRARGFTTTRDNESHYRLHIQPSIGDKWIGDWTKDDLRKLSRDLDAKVQAKHEPMAWKMALNVWATGTKMCDDAAESKHDTIRCRTDNPAEKVRGPERGDDIGKQFLYPAEFLKFVSHPEVPGRWKLVVTVAVYTYLRDGELRLLECRDVDLEHGSISVTKAWNRRTRLPASPKGGKARDVPIEHTLAPLLKALKEAGTASALVAEMPSERDMARGLRRWLLRAGVDRHELHHTTPTTRPIRFHDLRGTGITWRAFRNDPKFEIQSDAGHENFSTTECYLQLVTETRRRSFGTPFPELPEGILGGGDDQGFSEPGPESFVPRIVSRDANYPKSLRGGRDSNPRPPA